eukprot:g1059.t1
MFRSLKTELSFEIPADRIKGAVPKGLRGCFMRNGPGLFERGGNQNIHNIDCDGQLVRISFGADGRVFFANKFVRTQGFEEEEKAGKLLSRGVYGTVPADWVLGGRFSKPVFKNTANTNQVLWNDEVLALWEGGLPHSVDTQTLATKREDNLGGLLKNSRQQFSAHPRIDAQRGHLVNFGANLTKRKPQLTVWEVDGQYRPVQTHKVHLLRRGCLAHDFLITENFVIFVQSPVQMKMMPMFMGKGIDEFMVDADTSSDLTLLYIMPRDYQDETNHRAKVFSAPAGFTYHHINAFEEEEEEDGKEDGKEDGGSTARIVIDTIVYPQKPPLDMYNVTKTGNVGIYPGRLTRYELSVPRVGQGSSAAFAASVRQDKKGTAPQPVSLETFAWGPPSIEMPKIHPGVNGRPYRYFYALDTAGVRERTDPDSGDPVWDPDRPPWSALVKGDVKAGAWSSWQAPARCFLGDPVFVPHADAPGAAAGAAFRPPHCPVVAEEEEDRGWVLTLLFSAATGSSHLLIIDATDVAAGPVCTIDLMTHVPWSFHCAWHPDDAPGILGDAPVLPPTSRL